MLGCESASRHAGQQLCICFLGLVIALWCRKTEETSKNRNWNVYITFDAFVIVCKAEIKQIIAQVLYDLFCACQSHYESIMRVMMKELTSGYLQIYFLSIALDTIEPAQAAYEPPKAKS